MSVAADPVVITDLQMDHKRFSARRLVWNYDDTQGAGILFSAPPIRKQDDQKERQLEGDVCDLTRCAACWCVGTPI